MPDRAWLVLLLLCGVQLCRAQPAGPEDGWVALFNGRDLSGWTAKIRGYPAGDNALDTFRVENGLLTVSYDGYRDFSARYGHLFYRQPFSHYRIQVEYRFIGRQARGGEDWARRNSGLMLHAQAPETMPPGQDFPIALEFQFLGGLDDGNARPTGNLCSPGTHVVHAGEFTQTHCINSDSPTLDGDQWVWAEALVLGNERIVHSINGQPVIEYGGTVTGGGVVSGHVPVMKPEGHVLDSGYIALQSESHPIQFRRIELQNLKGCMDPDADNFRPWFVEADPDSCRYTE